MSVYTPVGAAQLQDWLKRYSVGSLLDLQDIAAGIENSNFFVTTTHGRYVLTLFERLGRAELGFYIHLLAHLARHGIPVPAPIADRDNDYLGTLAGKPAVLVTRLSGGSVDSPSSEQCAQVGAMLADMHLAGLSYGRRLDNPRGAPWWRASAAAVRPFLDAADAALLDEELRFQALFGFADLPRGVIHGDLFRDNVLFDDGRVGGLIDFYFAGHDALLLDVAITVNAWCTERTGALLDAPTRALLHAYHATRPFVPLERGAWPVLLRAAALRFWLSRLYDFHLPRPGVLTHRKDPNRFRDVLRLRAAAGARPPWIED